jgi:hypothetical protein
MPSGSSVNAPNAASEWWLAFRVGRAFGKGRDASELFGAAVWLHCEGLLMEKGKAWPEGGSFAEFHLKCMTWL